MNEWMNENAWWIISLGFLLYWAVTGIIRTVQRRDDD